MAIKQEITQQQGMRQQLRLSQQQLLVANLIEGSIVELEDKVKKELDNNPALDTSTASDDSVEDEYDDIYEDNGAQDEDWNEGSEGMEEGLYVDYDDESESYGNASSRVPEDYNQAYTYYQDLSDYLNSQIDSLVDDPLKRKICYYIIGSLNEEGFISDEIDKITDDINIYQGLDVSVSDVLDAVQTVQSLDPPGVGARGVAECLRLQAERRMTGVFSDDFIPRCAVAILDEFFDLLTSKKYSAIIKDVEVERNSEGLFVHITKEEFDKTLEFIKSLNPHPCSAIADAKLVKGVDSITPDFFYSTENGHLTVNCGNIPKLTVNDEYVKMLQDIEKRKSEGEALKDDSDIFLRDRIDSAKEFIGALELRKSILSGVMSQIIKVQKDFFMQGCDDSLLKPLTMKQVADAVNCDISTVSRVANSKYISIDGQYTFKIKYFFSEKISTESGQMVSNKAIMGIIKNMIANEDKRHPLPDETIAASLQQQGYNVARRTVAKYRSTLNIPSTKDRRK